MIWAILRSHLEIQQELQHLVSVMQQLMVLVQYTAVMEKLVDIVHFLHLEIHSAFGSCGNAFTHFISSVPPSTRDALYLGLPPCIKSALRTRLQSFPLKEEFTVAQIKAEMEKTLQWLVPMATNTTKAHHGFGWVGEWANTGIKYKTISIP